VEDHSGARMGESQEGACVTRNHKGTQMATPTNIT